MEPLNESTYMLGFIILHSAMGKYNENMYIHGTESNKILDI